MSIAVKSGLPSLGSTEGAVISADEVSVSEDGSAAASVGEDLPRGKSAYEIAKENGFNGTETEWLASLKGATGAPGADGKDGTDGKTPYVGDNGNWFVGSDDTGKPSRGAKGEKGEKGDTGAQGIQGEQGIQGVQGEKGEKGDTGAQGPQGLQGPQGAAGADGKTPNLTIGTVTTLDAGQNATASITGESPDLTLNLGIPKGAKGEPGMDGVTPTFSIESVETGEPGTDAEVTMTGDAPNHGLRFVIPRGDKGDKGDTDVSLGLTSAAVGQIIKVKAVDESGKPTAWEAANMPSGGGGHWETVLDTVWEQDVINPTAFDSETGIFTCAEGELNNLELNKEYVFFQQCKKQGVAYNTILGNENLKVTKLSDTTFSIDVTPPATFVPTNVKFSKGACLAVTDIDARKIRLTLDGQFKPTATLYDKPFYGTEIPYFGMNTGYQQIRNAYQAYQQVTAEVESPYRIVGEILCGFNAPSQNGNFHFKNNSFCCPLVPYDVPEGNERTYFLTSDGTKIAKLYSTISPWILGSAYENTAISNDYLKIISGTKVKLERWVE